MMQTRMQKYSLLAVVNRSQWQNIFLHYMWQWWTLQYRCYCHALICRVSNCCLSLYLHVAGDYDRVLENTVGVMESPGIYLGQDCGNPVLCWVMLSCSRLQCWVWHAEGHSGDDCQVSVVTVGGGQCCDVPGWDKTQLPGRRLCDVYWGARHDGAESLSAGDGESFRSVLIHYSLVKVLGLRWFTTLWWKF